MRTGSITKAHGGTNVKHEQQGGCSTKLGNKNIRTKHGGGIAWRLMLLWLLAFTLVGGTAWGQTVNINVPGDNYNLECGKTYVITGTTDNVGVNSTTAVYKFTNTSNGTIVIVLLPTTITSYVIS
jgi:hypothetical protein